MRERRIVLRDGLAVRGADLAEDRVGEDVVLALGERAPGLDLDAVLAHHRLVGGALVERVRLDLVDGRRDLAVQDEIDEPVGVEVRQADRLGQALAVDLLLSRHER